MLANEQGVLCKLKMTLLTILNEIPKKTPAFFLAKSARFGSKKCHQKDISTINAQSIYAKIVSITNIFTSAKLLCIKFFFFSISKINGLSWKNQIKKFEFPA